MKKNKQHDENLDDVEHLDDETGVQQETDAPDTTMSQCRCDEYKAGWARAQADYQNLQRDVEKKQSDWMKMSEVHMLEEFIPVYDNFKKAFAATQGVVTTEQEAWIKGIEYIKKQFSDILKKYNVEEVGTVGELFDPVRHQVLGEEESTVYDAGVIVREIEGGYAASGRVLKVAKVIVAK